LNYSRVIPVIESSASMAHIGGVEAGIGAG
jgi:hypothetical protein